MVFEKTHIRLGVRDTDRSAAFYEALLGAAPASRTPNVAIFDLESPPLVLTVVRLQKQARAAASALSPGPPAARRARFALHVGEPRLVGDAAIALRRVGVRLRLEDEGLEAHDPDGNAWRVRFVPSTRGRTVVHSDPGGSP